MEERWNLVVAYSDDGSVEEERKPHGVFSLVVDYTCEVERVIRHESDGLIWQSASSGQDHRSV